MQRGLLFLFPQPKEMDEMGDFKTGGYVAFHTQLI
jgi:hypothetical protein